MVEKFNLQGMRLKDTCRKNHLDFHFRLKDTATYTKTASSL